MEITRRSFLGGMSALAAVGALGMSACSAKEAGSQSEESDDASVVEVDETRDCDIVIIGAGTSGLAAAVQAADEGRSVICVDSSSTAGGGATGVEGVFGVGSQMQKDQDIEVSVGDLVRTELVQNQYRNSSLVLKDLLHTSGEDIDWLAEHGVLFGAVDNYVGFHPIFHWFQTGNGAESYIPQMQSAAESAGAEFVFGTHADSLIKDDSGKVTGVLCSASGGTVVQINAKAVILATGGFAENRDLVMQVGFNDAITLNGGMFGDGSGYEMATSVGGSGNIQNAGFLGAVTLPGLPAFYEGGYFCSVMNACADQPTNVWVNGLGERFVNEDLSLDNHMVSANLAKSVDSLYILMDEEMMTAYINGDEEGEKELADALDSGLFFQGDGWTDLAAKLGMEGSALEETVATYNGYCSAGVDDDYGKSADFLKPLASSGVVYALDAKISLSKSVGCTKTDRDFRVIDGDSNPIEGLYAIGTEGAMVWANVYTMNLSGSCAAHNVYSARTAVKHAVANLM